MEQSPSDLSPRSPSAPFVAGSLVEDPGLFVGREDALDFITRRMTGPQPTSVNIVGERRIGKSSLLFHFARTWRRRVEDPEPYVVAYLSLQDGRAQREEDFYRLVATALGGQTEGERASIWSGSGRWDRAAFSAALEQCRERGVLPVLCLDDFEVLFKEPDAFDDGFFDSLRSAMSRNVLMLVVALRRPLAAYREQYGFESDFFNVGQDWVLRGLEDAGIDALVGRWDGTGQAVLGLPEQALARLWGGDQPWRLQLAALCLWEARQQAKDPEWAQMQFEVQAGPLPQPGGRLRQAGGPPAAGRGAACGRPRAGAWDA